MKKREELIKSDGEQIIIIYIWKSRFLDLTKGLCEGNLRKRFKLCVTHMAARFVAPDEDVNSDQCQLFNIFRAVFSIYTGKKCSEYLFCGMNDTKAARLSKRETLTEEGTLCSWGANYHILFLTFTLSRTHVLCHDYCQVHQFRLHWENAEMFPIF